MATSYKIKRFGEKAKGKILNTNMGLGFLKGRKYDTDLDRLGRLDTALRELAKGMGTFLEEMRKLSGELKGHNGHTSYKIQRDYSDDGESHAVRNTLLGVGGAMLAFHGARHGMFGNTLRGISNQGYGKLGQAFHSQGMVNSASKQLAIVDSKNTINQLTNKEFMNARGYNPMTKDVAKQLFGKNSSYFQDNLNKYLEQFGFKNTTPNTNLLNVNIKNNQDLESILNSLPGVLQAAQQAPRPPLQAAENFLIQTPGFGFY